MKAVSAAPLVDHGHRDVLHDGGVVPACGCSHGQLPAVEDRRVRYECARRDWRDETWQQRWHHHPSPHNSRAHLHPPPVAATFGEDRSWPTGYRDVLAHVLAAVGDRDADR